MPTDIEPEDLYRTFRTDELCELATAFEADRANLIALHGPAASLEFCDGRLLLLYRLLAERGLARP